MWPATWHDGSVDDHALVRALRAGDRRAFDVLVERETGAVYRACLRILGRPHDAEDVTQQVFTKLITAIPKYEERSVPFVAWLLLTVTFAWLAAAEVFARAWPRVVTAGVPMRMPLVTNGDQVSFGVGGAVISLSDPHEEFEETAVKATAVLRLFGAHFPGR